MLSFRRSNELLSRALEVIPTGAQTFSKSYLQYPQGQAPLFFKSAVGGKIIDADGNSFVDLVSALLPIVLGYQDNDVNAAVIQQVSEGSITSLSSIKEIELAETLCRLIPCAEMVRFGKNGSDATSAAIRLARAFTGRDHVLSCGYHGWHDWYIASTTRNVGIPAEIASFTERVNYNDLNGIESALCKKEGKIAAVIIEPVSYAEPTANFLSNLRQLCDRHGSLLIFDETVTGFRVDLGGAQKFYNVTPDLSTFGKAMANGYPISAVVGRRDIMRKMNDIFFSGTFGGELVSIAASLATIGKIEKLNVCSYLWEYGREIYKSVNDLIIENGLEEVVKLIGIDPWRIVSFQTTGSFDKDVLKTFFITNMIQNGVLISSSHNVTFAHNEVDHHIIINAYTDTLQKLKYHLNKGDLMDCLKTPVIRPVFSVRGA